MDAEYLYIVPIVDTATKKSHFEFSEPLSGMSAGAEYCLKMFLDYIEIMSQEVSCLKSQKNIAVCRKVSIPCLLCIARGSNSFVPIPHQFRLMAANNNSTSTFSVRI